MKDISDEISNEVKEYFEEYSKSFISKTNDFKTDFISDDDFEHILSKDVLYENMKDPYMHINGQITNKINMGSQYDSYKMVEELKKFYPEYHITQSGDFLYNKHNGIMGWHTNADASYKRVYFSYSVDGNSFFRYYDKDKDEIVTSWDKKGVNVREFDIDKDDFFWHCVGSKCYRTSIGFRIIKKYA